MNPRRALLVATVAVSLATALSGCTGSAPVPSGSSSAPGHSTPTPTAVLALSDTSWSGTDSKGDATEFTFHPGGSVAVSYGTHSYDDPLDTWKLEGSTLTIDVYVDKSRGVAEYAGTVSPGATTLKLSATYEGEADTFTLDITRK